MKSLGVLALSVFAIVGSSFSQVANGEPSGATIQFSKDLTPFETCVLEEFLEQSPIQFKEVLVTDPVTYGHDYQGNEVRERAEVGIMAVTLSNHPAVLRIGISSTDEYVWRRVNTGGLPYFITDGYDSEATVFDATTGDRVWTYQLNCE